MNQSPDLLPPRDAIQRAFERFHEANPHVYARIVRMAREDRRKQIYDDPLGDARLSMKAIFEDMRRAGFGHLNNDFTSRYADLVMAQEPDLHGLFETRSRRALLAPEAVIERAA